MLQPKIIPALKGYTKAQFAADATAGLIVGIVALPLAIAFAIASGVSPDRGLYTAIVAGFIISVLGGSRVQIGGPTGAFVVIVYGIVQQHGYDGLAIATVMAGIMMIALGVFRLGSAIKFIPHPLIVGFTSGIAVIIFTSQIKEFLGLNMKAVPADFLEKWAAYAEHVGEINPHAFAIAGGAVLVIVVWQHFIKIIPGSLVALILATAIVQFFSLPVETIGSRFGDIPSTLPAPSLPTITLAKMRALSQPAFTIALLGGIESLLSAIVADGMIGGKHRSNMELVAQGIANIASPIFGGIPATGAIARTATNIKNGARTPIAGIVHAIVLTLIMLLAAPLAKLIPMPALAAILVVVAYNMSEWRTFVSLLNSPRSDVLVLSVTFLLTVVIDLTVAIEVGLVISVFLFMRRMAMVTNVGVVTREMSDEKEEMDDPLAIAKRDVPPGVEVFEINGPFFFGAAYKFEEAMSGIETQPKALIIRMRNVMAIDSTGIHVLKQVQKTSAHRGTTLILSGVHSQPLIALEKSALLKTVGEENIFGNIDDALNRAREIIGLPKVDRVGPFVPTVAREQRSGATDSP